MLARGLLALVILIKLASESFSAVVQFEELDTALNDICDLKPNRGNCFGSYERWHYNSKTKRCNKFQYTGCGGNDNRFLTWGQCKLQCPYKKSFNVDCREPKRVGYCYSRIPRWYYNTVTEKCRKFFYSGCSGNKNRFTSKKHCESNCPARRGCLEPKMRGPCNKYITRFYFNQQTKQCELFIYGGCQGNHNNFQTREDCQGECPIEVKKRRRNRYTSFSYTWY